MHRAIKHLRNTQWGPYHCVLPYLPHGGRSWASWAGVPAGGQTGLNVTTNDSYNSLNQSQACGHTTNNHKHKLTCLLCPLAACPHLAERQKEKKDFIKELLKTLHSRLHTHTHFFCVLLVTIISCSGAFACAVHSTVCPVVSPYRYVLKIFQHLTPM